MKRITQIIDINAHITNVKYEIVSENNNAIAIISFENLGFGVINAIKFNAKGYNSFGDIVSISDKDSFLIIIQDIMVKKNDTIRDIKIKLPNNAIKKLELEECQICYSDGKVISYEGKREISFELEKFDDKEKEQLDALRDVFDSKVTYKLLENEYGWICTCGRFNDSNETTCNLCNKTKNEVKYNLSETGLKEAIEEKKLIDKKRKEEEIRKVAEKERLNKEKRRKIIIGIIITIIVCTFLGRTIVMSKRKIFKTEDEMKKSLQGTYTNYSDSGKASCQIVISGNELIYRWSYGSDLESEIKEWNYKSGKIHTFEDIIVTKEGNLRQGDKLYKRGGYMPLKSDEDTYSPSYESAYTALNFSNIYVSSNSSYTICTGKITNNGKKTYKFVQIKGSFKNSSGKVVDTDSTYAVGNEGLAPGESKTFRMSVDKNYDIKSCSVSIYDYD